MATTLQFALSNPTPGMEEEFNRWYGEEHIPHGVIVPGILAGQRFRRIDSQPLPPGIHDFLVIWEMDNPGYALEQLAAVKGGDKMPISPSIDMTTVQPPTMWLRASFRNAARIPTDTTTRQTVVLALVNAAENQDEAFVANMLQGELARLADLKGVLSADFLTLADEQIRGNARKFRYGLLIELADEATALPAVKAALCNLPHFDNSKWIASAFQPLGPRMTKADAQLAGIHV